MAGRTSKIAALIAGAWLSVITLAAFYAKLDEQVSDPQLAEPDKGLPFLQDIYYQGTLWGTSERVESPSWEHWFGTDVLGRDAFARVIAGGYSTVTVVVIATIIGLVLGGGVGSVASWLGGRLDWTFQWLLDTIDAFPPVLFFIAVAGVSASARTATAHGIILGLLFVPSYIRAARVSAGSGGRDPAMVGSFGNVVGGVLPALVVVVCANAAAAVAVHGIVNFLGLGEILPAPTWGSSMNEARSEIGRTILPMVYPAFFMGATMLAFNQLANYVHAEFVTSNADRPEMPEAAVISF